MKMKRLKIIMLLIMLFNTYNIYAAETGSVDSSTPQEAEVLNKNRTILMGFDVGGSTNFITIDLGRALKQINLSYRYYFYPNKIQDKIKNGICLDFGFIFSLQADYTPYIDKGSALYFTSSILYSLNSYGNSVYNNFLFNIGFNANFFLKKLETENYFPKVLKPGYTYNFAQVGILLEIGYIVYTPDFKRAFVFKLIFKGLTEDISPVYSKKFSIYAGFTISLLFKTN